MARRKNESLGLIGGIIFFIVGLSIIIPSWRSSSMNPNRATAESIVTGVDTRTSTKTYSKNGRTRTITQTLYTPTVKFNANGDTVEATAKDSLSSTIEPGDKLKITYLKNSPESNVKLMTDGDDVMVAIAFGGLFAIIGAMTVLKSVMSGALWTIKGAATIGVAVHDSKKRKEQQFEVSSLPALSFNTPGSQQASLDDHTAETPFAPLKTPSSNQNSQPASSNNPMTSSLFPPLPDPGTVLGLNNRSSIPQQPFSQAGSSPATNAIPKPSANNDHTSALTPSIHRRGLQRPRQ